MNPILKSLITPLAVVLVLAALFFAWYLRWSPWKPVPLVNPVVVNDFDAFQRDLAGRVSREFGVDIDSVVVAPAAYGLGWLLDSVQTYPADSTDCVPTPIPSTIPAPHLFPSYQLASNTAATMTLGSDALQQLTSASLNLSHQAHLVYSIDQVQVLLMDLKSVDQISHVGACGDYVSQHPKTRLIRGLVLGKISFKFSTDNPISAQAKLPKLGGISAKGDPNTSTVTVADDQPSQILEMVSILQATPVATSPAGSQPIIAHPSKNIHLHGGELTATATAPIPIPAEAPHIYFQQDIADQPGTGTAIAEKLHQNWPTAFIEAKVERIPTSKMPSTSQIRFFNAVDQALANTCRDHLKAATDIDARVVRIGLAAPAGQLEVWLQKTGNSQ